MIISLCFGVPEAALNHWPNPTSTRLQSKQSRGLRISRVCSRLVAALKTERSSFGTRSSWRIRNRLRLVLKFAIYCSPRIPMNWSRLTVTPKIRSMSGACPKWRRLRPWPVTHTVFCIWQRAPTVRHSWLVLGTRHSDSGTCSHPRNSKRRLQSSCPALATFAERE